MFIALGYCWLSRVLLLIISRVLLVIFGTNVDYPLCSAVYFGTNVYHFLGVTILHNIINVDYIFFLNVDHFLGIAGYFMC